MLIQLLQMKVRKKLKFLNNKEISIKKAKSIDFAFFMLISEIECFYNLRNPFKITF